MPTLRSWYILRRRENARQLSDRERRVIKIEQWPPYSFPPTRSLPGPLRLFLFSISPLFPFSYSGVRQMVFMYVRTSVTFEAALGAAL